MKHVAQFALMITLFVQLACNPYAATKTLKTAAASWQKLPLPAPATAIDSFDIKPNGDMFVTDRTTGVWKTTNNGQAWQQINTGLASLLGWTIQVNPHTGDLIANLMGNPSHFYVSHDEATWTQIPEPAGFDLTSTGSFDGGLMPPAGGGLMLLGGRGCNGCTEMYSSNDGTSTSLSVFSPTQGETESNGVNGSVYGFGGEVAGFYTSTNSGANFTQVWNCGASVGPTCGNSNDTNEIYSITTDGGGNWVISTMTGVFKSSGPASNPTGWTHLYTSSRRSRTVFRDSLGNYYFGQAQSTNNPTIECSTDGGNTWQECDTGIGTGLEAHKFVESNGNLYALIENGTTNQGFIYVRSQGGGASGRASIMP